MFPQLNHSLSFNLQQKGPSSACHNYKHSEIDHDEAKIAIVDIHNQFRSRVAQGLELRGNPGPQPPAANMLQLVIIKNFCLRVRRIQFFFQEWDDELAEIAQRIADQCFDPKQQFTDECRLTGTKRLCVTTARKLLILICR